MEGQSAGLTGCHESELVISEQDSSMSTETWIATCNGRRFVCSRATMGPTAYAASCTPESSEKKAAAAPQAANAAETPAPKPTSKAPTGAGGFHFGQTRDDAQSACTGGNFEFSPTDKGGSRCSGLLAELGYKAAAELEFCGDAVCKIALVLDATTPGEELLKSFRSLNTSLTKKYGEPAKKLTTLPSECTGAKVDECLKSGDIALSRTWSWPTAKVQLWLNQPNGAAEPRFVVLYSQKKSAEATPDAL